MGSTRSTALPRRSSAFRLAQSLLAAIVVVSCGISGDDAPRNIPVSERTPLGIGGEATGGAATGTARIYLLAPDSAGASTGLVAVARDVDDTPTALLQALFDGPNPTEAEQQYRTALPAELRLLSAEQRGGVLVVDVSRELDQLSGQQLVAAVAQIVITASELVGVRSVSLLVEGTDQQWPTASGVERGEPLTVYDYPGLLRSSQPAYPAVPSADSD